MKWFIQTLIESAIESTAAVAGFVAGVIIWYEATEYYKKSEEP